MRVDLFVEDAMQEKLVKALIARVASEEGVAVHVHDISVRGGAGAVLARLNLYEAKLRHVLTAPTPDLIVACVDGNCRGYVATRQMATNGISQNIRDIVVIACPLPYVERWYLADPTSFLNAVGAIPSIKQVKCERDYYKQKLAQAIVRGGNAPTLGGPEFAEEIVRGMDLYKAARPQNGLRHFIKDLRGWFRASRRVPGILTTR